MRWIGSALVRYLGWGLTAAVASVFVSASGCNDLQELRSTLGVHLKLDERKLSNGLTVVLVEDHTVPVVSYQTWFRVGSLDERIGLTGVSHLFEHLMFKGTPKYPAKKFFEELEAKGADINAATTKDYTLYYDNITPELLPKVIDMESDRMVNLTLNQTVLDTEKQVVLEERRMKTENSPAGKMQEALWELAYKVHPYGWPVVGYPEDVLRIQLSELIDYYKAHYRPSNAVVVVVGDFQKEPTFELIKKFYGPLPNSPQPKRQIRKEPQQQEERRLAIYDQVASERFTYGYHVTSATDDDSYALDVLSNILFEGSSSRAYRRLVEEKEIVLGVSGSNYTPSYPGLFMISGVMKGELPASLAEAELERLLGEVQEKGVSAEEVQIAIRQLTVQLVDGVRTSYGLGQLIGIVTMVFGKSESFAEDLAKYTKVKPSDVQRVARTYFSPNNRTVITLLPESRRKK